MAEAVISRERDLTDGVERSAIACPSVQQVIDVKVRTAQTLLAASLRFFQVGAVYLRSASGYGY